MDPKPKTYLGDAVYVERLSDGTVILTLEDGLSTTGKIVLEPDVIDALVAFVA